MGFFKLQAAFFMKKEPLLFFPLKDCAASDILLPSSHVDACTGKIPYKLSAIHVMPCN